MCVCLAPHTKYPAVSSVVTDCQTKSWLPVTQRKLKHWGNCQRNCGRSFNPLIPLFFLGIVTVVDAKYGLQVCTKQMFKKPLLLFLLKMSWNFTSLVSGSGFIDLYIKCIWVLDCYPDITSTLRLSLLSLFHCDVTVSSLQFPDNHTWFDQRSLSLWSLMHLSIGSVFASEISTTALGLLWLPGQNKLLNLWDGSRGKRCTHILPSRSYIKGTGQVTPR